MRFRFASLTLTFLRPKKTAVLLFVGRWKKKEKIYSDKVIRKLACCLAMRQKRRQLRFFSPLSPTTACPQSFSLSHMLSWLHKANWKGHLGKVLASGSRLTLSVAWKKEGGGKSEEKRSRNQRCQTLMVPPWTRLQRGHRVFGKRVLSILEKRKHG